MRGWSLDIPRASDLYGSTPDVFAQMFPCAFRDPRREPVAEVHTRRSDVKVDIAEVELFPGDVF